MAFTSGERGEKILGLALAAFFIEFLIDGLFGFNSQVPVSALMLFIVAGAAVGLSRPDCEAAPSAARRIPVPIKTCGLAFGAVLCVLGVLQFAAQFYNQRGCGALEYKDYPAAAACFDRAAALAPCNWVHAFYQGMARKQMNQPDMAARHFSRCLELNPNYLNGVVSAAEAYFDLAAANEPAALDTAIAHARHAAELNPLSPDVYDTLARTTFLRAKWLSKTDAANAQEAYKAAEGHFLKAIGGGSKASYKLYQLVSACRQQIGDMPGAEKALAQAAEEKPEDMETWRLFSQFSKSTGRTECLLESLKRDIGALKGKDPASAGALSLLRAQIMADAHGTGPATEEALDETLMNFPALVDAWAAYYAFAKLTGNERQFESRLAESVSSQERAGKNPPPLLKNVAMGLSDDPAGILNAVSGLADLIAQQPSGKYGWAAELLAARTQQTTLPADKTADIDYKLGAVFDAIGNNEQAVLFYERAAAGLSGDSLVLCLLQQGTCLAKAGNLGRAAQAFQRAVDLSPTNFDARYALAQTLAQDNQRARARDEYLTLLANFSINEEGRRRLQQEYNALRE
jgi:tetratricopeptide (TPR) repeat protein